MAKKKTTKSTSSNGEIIKFCAFWGIVLSALALFIGFFIKLLQVCGITISWANTIMGVCSMISMVALLVAVALPSYGYVRGKSRVWKIIFWVAIVLYVCGVVGIGLTI